MPHLPGAHKIRFRKSEAMEFRPCIDIHNGRVKQIVGASLRDEGDRASENFVASRDADYYARLYREDRLYGGHVILLNPEGSPFYEETREQAMKALRAFPGGLQAGGGITPENASRFLDAGASHVIVTSYVFSDGKIHNGNLERMVQAVGKEHLVLDLSCRRRENGYYVVTDRWQRFTDVQLDRALLERLSGYADEFLIHGVDVEGKAAGIEEELITRLAGWEGCPVTYAGGVRDFSDLEQLRELGGGRVHVTVGSALDLFGGSLPYREVAAWCRGSLQYE